MHEVPCKRPGLTRSPISDQQALEIKNVHSLRARIVQFNTHG